MRKGFTLVESIISVLLLAIIGIGVFSAFSAVQSMFYRTRSRVQAFNFAREAYDRLRSNYRYTDPLMEDNGPVSPHLESEIGTIIRGDMLNYTSSLIYYVSEVPGGYKEVTVSVRWWE